MGPVRAGTSAAELKARHGRPEMTRLNWNENLSGPFRASSTTSPLTLDQVWTYPEQAYEELRQGAAAGRRRARRR